MTSEKHAQANRAKAEALRMTTAQFIERAQAVHGGRYDYSNTVYAGALAKLTITCREHGDFEQKASSHMNLGQGCPKCAVEGRKGVRRTTADKYRDKAPAAVTKLRSNNTQFVEKARRVHGDRYDYSKSVYVNSSTKVTIICPEHGDFEAFPYRHLQGKVCPQCAMDARGDDTNTFTSKAREVHGDKYDYSKVVYVNAKLKVIITCREHGDFEQIAGNHIAGQGCFRCGIDKRILSTEEFIEKAREVHGDHYGYTKALYTDSRDNVTITCPKHGDFTQRASSHAKGCGCPACAKSVSQPELDIKALIESCGYEAQHRYRPAFMQGKELDLYVPALKLAIEYCGSHVHNVDSNLMGGEPKSKTYHYDKWKACRDNGVALLTIFDFQWLTKREKVEALLRHKLQQNNRRVYARKCTVVELDRATCWEFVKANHIEGTGMWKLNCTYKGLKLGDELLAVMVEQEGDIKRSCTRQGVAVIGGVSRLFKAFPSGTTMMTTNDTGSTGNYGTRLAKHTLRYWWVNNKTSEALTRNACMKHKLEQRFGVPVGDMTEVEYMRNLGWVRVFDSGLSYFVNT